MSCFVAMPGNEAMARALAQATGGSWLRAEVRRFPDRESHVRLSEPVEGLKVVVVCTLDDPDPKTVPLILAAGAARDNGAACVGLVAPYLAYLRQDAVFGTGEPLSARHYGRLLAGVFDSLITVDPHLHRIDRMGDIFPGPVVVVQAAPLLADWVLANVQRPVVIGPDAESRQWVAEVAERAGAPWTLMEKQRLGDETVRLRLPDLSEYRGRTPVLVDDIISTGVTLTQAAMELRRLGFAPPVCLAVHALFAAEAAWSSLRAAASRVVTTDTVPHPSNGVSISRAIAEALRG